MTYSEFQQYCAKFGLDCPITYGQYCSIKHLSPTALLGVVCDMNAGLSFSQAVTVNSRS